MGALQSVHKHVRVESRYVGNCTESLTRTQNPLSLRFASLTIDFHSASVLYKHHWTIPLHILPK